MSLAKRGYDIFFIWNLTLHCNFQCHYCINNPNTQIEIAALTDDHWQRSNKEKLQPIDIDAIVTSLNKTNKTYLLQLTGGEPLLIPNIVEVCSKLTKKHYIILNTNLSLPNIGTIIQSVVKEHVSYVVASFHLTELEKHNTLQCFMDNCRLLVANKIQVNLMSVAHPANIDKLLAYKKVFLEMGLVLNLEPFRGYYLGEKYPLVYSDPERKDFELASHMDNDFFMNKNKYCNAGYNIAYIDECGDVYPCTNKLGEKQGNIYTEFYLTHTLQKCAVEFCGCPFRNYDEGLFAQALMENEIG